MAGEFTKRMEKFSKLLGRPFQQGRELGMTLIEIIIVVALLGTLMTYLVTTLTNQADEARVDQSKLAMGNIAQKLQMYRVHNHKYPGTDQGLDALVNNPGDSKRWRGPYITAQKLLDPWSREFNYESDGKQYKIISSGIDEEFGTADDVVYPEEDSDATE